jgi:hypothetical protein
LLSDFDFYAVCENPLINQIIFEIFSTNLYFVFTRETGIIHARNALSQTNTTHKGECLHLKFRHVLADIFLSGTDRDFHLPIVA